MSPSPPTASPELLLRYEQAATVLACSLRHIHDLAARGLLEKVRIGPKASRVTVASVHKLARVKEAAR
jgi:hypothetical protein